VLFRRDWLATRIDQVAATRPGARVLAIACGHLREAAMSHALVHGQVKEFVGIDQDVLSLAAAGRDPVLAGARLVQGRVLDIVNGRLTFDDLDFIYAAGLLDDLPDELAQRLLAMCLASLRPGGWLLVGNFTPDNHGRGYMACFMDWQPRCRDEAALQRLVEPVRNVEIADRRLYRDPGRNVAYLELQRA